MKIMSNIKTENENDHFEIEFYDGKIKNELPISLFEEIEAELCDRLLYSSSLEEDDETDSAIEFIKNIIDKVKEESERLIEDRNQKKMLNTLTKFFTVLLSVKADNAEKIIKIVKLTVQLSFKIMVRTKLVSKRVRIRQWPPREPYTQFKIKTLLSEQKVVQIKKNGQVTRTVTLFTCRER